MALEGMKEDADNSSIARLEQSHRSRAEKKGKASGESWAQSKSTFAPAMAVHKRDRQSHYTTRLFPSQGGHCERRAGL